jgi:putative ABC transport system permease protein
LRLVTSLVGVVFSVVLVSCLAGLYVACGRYASGLVDHAGADLWLVAPRTASVDLGELISTRRLYQARAVAGVQWTAPLLVRFSQWRLPDGRREVAQIVGVDVNSPLGIPWGLSVDRRDALRSPRSVIIDERERSRFGPNRQPLLLGDRAEILNRSATVSAFTRDVGTFTAIPYVFTTHRQAEQFTGCPDGYTTFVAVKCDPGASIPEVRQALREQLQDVDVLTTGEFAQMTRNYWMFGTGIGAGMVFAALLGLTVGCVMVSQTIYASTISRLPEYATLKAMGMSNWGLTRIVLEQSMILGLMSYAVGMGVATLVATRSASCNLTIDLPAWLYAAMLFVTLGACTLASITSVAKVYRLPPASVFRS